MNLIDDAWIPVRCADGVEKHITPYQITEGHAENPIVQLNAPRPDFNGALAQFLIGLLQTACPPKDHDAWVDWLEEPPAPQQLRKAFDPYRNAFNLDGDGPRFMQDFTHLEGSQISIGNLLIDSPGDNTLKQFKDHFIKRGGVLAMCPSCAATALFALQINAPSGGQGHRTSLRGGGPLTTLVVYDPKGNEIGQYSLWQNLWLNVLERPQLQSLSGNQKKSRMEDIFPWMAPTRTSEKKTGVSTFPQDAHPLQIYWAMPRRIRLSWKKGAGATCDVCNCKSNEFVDSYVTKNLGVNYEGAWQHPLSPYHKHGEDGSIAPIHVQPGGIGYKHWVGIALGNEKVAAARVIRHFHEHRKESWEQLRIWAFGYDMDNMKARCWYESTIPLYLLDDSIRMGFSAHVQSMVEAATEAADYLRSCVKQAWFRRPGDAKGDTSFLAEAFFYHTESAFFDLLEELRKCLIQRQDHLLLLEKWHRIITREALDLFDRWAGFGDIAFENPHLIATARTKLKNLLYRKRIRELLQLPDKRRTAA